MIEILKQIHQLEIIESQRFLWDIFFNKDLIDACHDYISKDKHRIRQKLTPRECLSIYEYELKEKQTMTHFGSYSSMLMKPKGE